MPRKSTTGELKPMFADQEWPGKCIIQQMVAKGQLFRSKGRKSSYRHSSVWESFSLLVSAEGEYSGYAQCDVCGAVLRYDSQRTGTSSLARHRCTVSPVQCLTPQAEVAVPQPLPMQQSQQPQPVVAKPKSTPPPALQPAPPPPPPPPPEVCLRWNSYQSNIQSVFPNLLSKEQFVDVTLACEGKSIKCHKVMLSACSTYFEELLSENPCQHPIVLMKDLKFWEVEALVNFMYHGEVNVGQDKLPSLLVAAEALQIKGLASPSSSSQEDSNQEASSVETSRQSIGEEELRAKRGRKRRAVPEAPSVMQASPPPVRPAVPQRPRPVTNTSSAYQSPKTAPSEPKQKRSSLPVVTNVQSIKVEPIEIVDDDEDSRPAEPVAIFTEPYKETGESSKQPDSGGTDKGGSTDGTDTGNDEGQGTGYGMELTSDTVTPDQKSDFGQFQSDSSVSQGYSDDAESADVDCKTSINTV